MNPSNVRKVYAVAFVCGAAASTVVAQGLGRHFIVESYPAPVEASRQVYESNVAAAASSVGNVPYYLLVPKLQRWNPGETIRVAFDGGDAQLRAKVAAAASRWIADGGANIALSFTDAAGGYRTWSASDTGYAAEIRIAFASGPLGGYWSHVGTDSRNAALVGGKPGEASMNLEGFDRALPPDWEATVIHEFGHALGFQHEHQNPSGGCDFRYEDDAGYVPTTDEAGWFTLDDAGRRPGLYTYLGGKANYWPREKVDHNLRALKVSSAYLVGAFDRNSVMKYFFAPFMFKAGDRSPCYTPTENLRISPQDGAGARTAYPTGPLDVAAIAAERRSVLQQLESSAAAGADLRRQVARELKAF